MSKIIDISVIILTYNDEKNIIHTLNSIYNKFSEIVILDSNSTDKTIEICKQFTNKIYFRDFDNFASQRNFAINSIQTINEYIFFLDSDEIVSNHLIEELAQTNLQSYDSYYIKRKFIWYGCWMKYGGYYPLYLMRIGKKNKIYYEGEVNEHMFLLSGKSYQLKYEVIDYFNKPFKDWINKHIKYSQYECIRHFKNHINENKKNRIWKKMPLFIRPFLLFFYRFIYKLGFLMGIKGIIYILLHTVFYRSYIDYLIFKVYLSRLKGKIWKKLF